jgi:hypothetical protein
MDLVWMSPGPDRAIPYREPVVWMVLEGALEIRYGIAPEPLRAGRGDVVLLPAALPDGRLRATEPSTWIEARLPDAAGR